MKVGFEEGHKWEIMPCFCEWNMREKGEKEVMKITQTLKADTI